MGKLCWVCRRGPHVTNLIITLIDWEEDYNLGNFRIPKDFDYLIKQSKAESKFL